MRIFMCTDCLGSADGIDVRPFSAGWVYDVPDSLARAWIADGMAVEARLLTKHFPKENDCMTRHRRRMLVRVSAPGTEPLTLAESKLYLRVDGSAEDALITDLIVAARMYAESWMKRSLISQAWKLVFEEYVSDITPLPMGPVISLTSLTLIGRDGSLQPVENGYYLNAAQDALLLDTPVFGHRIEIVYATGYGDSTAVPKPIKQGMLAHVAALYDRRGEDDVAAFPDQAARLYLPFREMGL